MHGSRSYRIIAGLLAALTTIQSTVAFADAPRGRASTYTFSSELPNQGDIDMYHNVFTLNDRTSDALYLLRNIAIEDLLNNRKALKILLGGTERARRVSGDSSLTFDVPSGVIDLYLNGELGRSFDSIPGSGGPVGSGSHGITTARLPEIGRAIHWFTDNEPTYNANLRTRQLMDWIHFSARITRYDQLIKFLKEDFWNNRAISTQFYNEFVKPAEDIARRTAREGQEPSFAEFYEPAKRIWMAGHETEDQLAVLEGHRDMQLGRYNLLGITVGSGGDAKPLYQHIYKAMESFGFPSAAMVQTPVSRRLPTGRNPIPLPTRFDTAANAALDQMISSDAEINRLVTTIGGETNAKIDAALLESLKVNTQRLAELTSEIHYSGSLSSPLLELAQFDELWEAAMQKYGYMDGLIDLAGKKASIQATLAHNDRVFRNTTYVLYGVGIGVGIALGLEALLAAGATEALGAAGVVATAEAVASSAASTGIRSLLLHGSSLMVTTASTMNYVRSRSAAKLSRGMYLGTMSSGSHRQYRQDELMEESAFQELVLSLIFLGHTPGVLAGIGKGVDLVQQGGRTLVRLSAEELALLRSGLAQAGRRAEILTPMGRMLFASARSLLGMAAEMPAVMSMEEAINTFSVGMRMSRAEIIRKLETNALIGPLVQRLGDGVRARFAANPDLWSKIIREEVASVGLQLSIEAASRENAGDQIGNIAIHTMSNAFATGMMVILTAPLTRAGAVATAAGAVQPSGFVNFMDGFAQSARAYPLMRNGSQMGLVAFMGSLASNTFGELIRMADPNDTESTWDHGRRVLGAAAFSGVFSAFSTNLRRMVAMSIEANLARLVSNQNTTRIMLWELSTANNAFGTWQYVQLAQLVGFEKHDGTVVSSEQIDPNGDPSEIRRLVLERGGGHYFRIEEDDGDQRPIYDFVRSP